MISSLKKQKNEDNKRNLVQVFGLPRSGTNFIEWTLNNNFYGINYINLYQKCNTKGLSEYRKHVALKHSYPTLDYSDYAIVIFKEYKNWVDSIKRGSSRGKSRGSAPLKTYDEYLKRAQSLDQGRTLIVQFTQSYNNYGYLITQISDLVKIAPVVDFKQPQHRLNRGGADSSETGEIFTL